MKIKLKPKDRRKTKLKSRKIEKTCSAIHKYVFHSVSLYLFQVKVKNH